MRGWRSPVLARSQCLNPNVGPVVSPRILPLILCRTFAAHAARRMTTQRLPEMNHADEQAAS